MEGISPLRPVATGMRPKEDMPFLYLVDNMRKVKRESQI
jgi:hypothetical protein